MGRRSDHSREELEKLAIAAATKIVIEIGLDGLTVRKVASAIGYSPGTLYNLFENRDDLVLRIAGHALDAFYDYADQAFKDRGTLNGLHQLCDAYIDFTQDNERIWDTVVGYRLDLEAVPDWYWKKAKKLFGLIEMGLDPFISAQQPQEKYHASLTLWAAIQGLSSMASRARLGQLSDASIKDLSHDLVNKYVAGIGAADAA